MHKENNNISTQYNTTVKIFNAIISPPSCYLVEKADKSQPFFMIVIQLLTNVQ